MTFVHPEALWLIIACFFLAVFLAYLETREQKEAARALATHFHIRITQKVIIKFYLAFLALALLSFLLAGPQAKRTGTDLGGFEGMVVFAFDSTKSMEARTSPELLSRLERSKELALRILDDLDNAAVGICVFGATHNCLISPAQLERDSRVARTVISDFVVTNAAYGAGSDITASLKSIAEEIVGHYGDRDVHPLVVVFTDGEQTVIPSAEDIVYMKNSGVRFVLIGVGEREGAAIPVFKDGKFTGQYEEFRGRAYISFLDEAYLRDLARRVGGEYFFEKERARIGKFVKANLPKSKVEQMPATRATAKNTHIVFWPALLLAITAFIIFTKKYIL